MGKLAGTMLHLVDSLDQAMEFKRWLGRAPPAARSLGLDTETSGLNPYAKDAAIRLIQFGDGEHGWAMSWDLWKGLALEALRRLGGRLGRAQHRRLRRPLDRGALPVPVRAAHGSATA